MFRKVKLPPIIPGALFLHRMPGYFEPLSLPLVQCSTIGITRIVCLAPMPEIKLKSPGYASAIISGSLPAELLLFPIPDLGVPSDIEAFLSSTKEATVLLSQGEKILIHCGMGIGRTAIYATALLMHIKGFSYSHALDVVTQAGSKPETGRQRNFLVDISNHIENDQ